MDIVVVVEVVMAVVLMCDERQSMIVARLGLSYTQRE